MFNANNGFTSLDKVLKIYEFIKNNNLKRTCEIGVFSGYTLIPMALAHRARAEGLAIGIDPWNTGDAFQVLPSNLEWVNKDITPTVDFDAAYKTLISNISKYKLEDYCKIIKKTSLHAQGEVGEIDFLHIDGNHGEEAVRKDFDIYFEKIIPGGYVWFDDADWETIKPTVEYAKTKTEIIEEIGNQIILKKPSYYNVKKRKTNISGLKYEFSIAPELSDDANHFTFFTKKPNPEFSLANSEILSKIILESKPKTIVEIGVCYWDMNQSSTKILIEQKDEDSIYLGIDVNDKSFVDDPTRKVYTHRGLSQDFDVVKNVMDKIGIKKIDFLFIDGLHSVNQILLDWQYSKWMSENGIIVMHDVNIHPGPSILYDAIDDSIYEKKRYCEYGNDFGIAVIKK